MVHPLDVCAHLHIWFGCTVFGLVGFFSEVTEVTDPGAGFDSLTGRFCFWHFWGLSFWDKLTHGSNNWAKERFNDFPFSLFFFFERKAISRRLQRKHEHISLSVLATWSYLVRGGGVVMWALLLTTGPCERGLGLRIKVGDADH